MESPGPAPAGVVPDTSGLRLDARLAALDFASLTDVSAGTGAEYVQTSFNEDRTLLFADAGIRNIGQYEIRGPLLVGITNLSDPAVHVRGADGLTPAGIPYFDFTRLLDGLEIRPTRGDNVLSPGETTAARTIAFSNPNQNEFTYDVLVLGQLNRPPAFTTQPDVEALVGRAYTYHAAAADPDGDPRTFSLLLGPAGMAVDQASGQVTWQPGQVDQGNHAVALRVDDGHGGSAEQHYVLAVIDPPPNRPPLFTSTPVVQANVNTLYEYEATAEDADGDSLTFSLVPGPAGMMINPATGLVTWTPTADQLGTQDITLQVADGQGGTATQMYAVLVQPELGNHAPVIISDPVIHFSLPGQSNPPVGDVDPTRVDLDLEPGEVGAKTVALTLPAAEEVPAFENVRGTLHLGETVVGALHPLGGRDKYTFTLAERSLLYFNSLTNSADLRWTLVGPAGTAVEPLQFAAVSVSNPVNVPAGDYELTVDGAGPYQFRLWDLAQASPLTPGAPVEGALAPANETDLYRFAAAAGDQFFFDVQDRSGTPFAAWRLVDPYGNTLFDTTFRFDVDTLTLAQAGTYTLLLEGYIGDIGSGSYTFVVQPMGNVPPTPVSGTPLVLGSLLSDMIGVAGEKDRYTFSLAAPAQLYLDSLTNNNNLRWSLDGPAGTAVSNRPFDREELVLTKPGVELPPGDYVLTVDAAFGATGAYGFRLWNLAQAAPLTPGAPVSGALDPANETDLYRFDAAAGDRFFFDVQAKSGAPGARWRLLDPYGKAVFNTSLFDVLTLALAAAGTYTLLVEGSLGDTVSSTYTFNVQPVTSKTEPLPLGETVRDSIVAPGEQRRYTFSLPVAAQLYFDSLSSSFLVWSLKGQPAGMMVKDRSFRSSDGQISPGPEDFSTGSVLGLPAGDYTLTVYGLSNETGPYQFRLVDLASARTLTAGVPEQGMLDPANETDLYRFKAASGDRFFFDVQQRDSALSGAYWQLLDPSGHSLFSTSLRDVDTLTLAQAGTYTLLVEGYVGDSGSGSYTFNVQPVAFTTEPLQLGETVSASIGVPGQQRFYTFSLAAPARLYFDSLTNGSLRWSLDGPAGRAVSEQPFYLDGPRLANPLLDLAAGEYTLTVSGLRGVRETDRFRLLDLAGAAPLTPGLAVGADLDPGNETDLYRFDAAAGDVFFFHMVNASDTGGAGWRLFGPFGNPLFFQTSLTDAGQLTLPIGGTYTLAVEGYINYTAADTYTLNVEPRGNEPPLPVAGTPLAPGSTVRGDISVAGERDLYTFRVTFRSLLYFDSLTSTSSLTWTLDGPGGTLVSSRSFGNSDAASILSNPVLNLVPGDYTLTVSGVGTATGEYGFRLWDLAQAAALTPGTPVSGVLDPANETDLYRFDAAAGDRFLFDSQQLSAASANWRLIDPYGNVVWGAPFTSDQGTLSLSQGGTYTLLVEGAVSNTGTGTYRFNVQRPRPFAVGDVFVAGKGVVQQYDKDLKLIAILHTEELPPNVPPSIVTGMAFDSTRNLYVTNFKSHTITKFDVNGDPVSSNPFLFTDPLGFFDESIVFDGAGNFYVGQASGPSSNPFSPGTRDVLKFAPTGALLDRLDVATTQRGSDWVDLAPDQRTLFYTSEGKEILRYDVRSHTQLAQFGRLPGSNAYALRILPDGGVLVADTEDIKRLDASGNIIRSYDVSGEDVWFALNLDVDGTSFWSANAVTGNFYKFDIDSGQVLQSGSAGKDYQPGGVTVLGELTAATRGIEVAATDSTVPFENRTGAVRGVGPGEAATFDVTFTGDGRAHSFDLKFVLEGTGNILGSIPVTMNNDYHYPVQAIDADGDVLTYRLAAAPAGATIDAQTGRITWEPPAAGTYQFVVQVDDGHGGQATQQYDLTVRRGDPNQDPLITSAAPTRATVGQPFAYAVTASDPDGDLLCYYLSDAPDGMTINRTTGVVSWIPKAAQQGTRTATLRVLDGREGEASQLLTLAVVADSENHNPHILSTPPADASAGQLYRYDVRASDPDADPLQFDLVVKPDGMTVAAATGVLTWRPEAGQVGRHDVILRVRDGRGGVDLQAFVVMVTAGNTAPVITSKPPGPAVAGLPYQYPVRAQDAEGDAIAFRLDAFPGGMAIDAATGLVTWAPTAGQLGSHPVTITAKDAHGAETSQSFDLGVVTSAPNDPPVITSRPRGTTPLGSTYLYAVEASDPNGDPLTYLLETAPAGMTLNAARLILWAPTPDQFGPNPVRLRVEDGRGGAAVQDFTVDVVAQGSNLPPAIVSTPGGVATAGRPYRYDAKALDPEGDALVWTLEAPTGMSIDPSLGTIRWTPTLDQLGGRDVVVRVADTQGGSASQSFTITVRAGNLPPAITSTPPTRAAATQAYRYAVHATDVDSDPLTYLLSAAPAGMTIDAATGLIQWIPDTTGPQTVFIRVEDGQGGIATQTYTVVVSATALNLPPKITSTPSFRATVGEAYAYTVTASDPEGETLQFVLLGSPPAGMSIDATTGAVQWVPAPSQLGGHQVTVGAVDPAGNGASLTFTLTVLPANHAPTITSAPVPSVTAGLLYRYDVQAADPDGDPLVYTLAAGPPAMSIDALGRITWFPAGSDVGTHHVEVAVADGRGGSASQSYDLAVVADTEAPRVSLLVSSNPAALGSSVTFLVSASDNVGVAARTLTVGGVPVGLDADGRATVLVQQVGQVAVLAAASDAAGNSGQATATVGVVDTSDVSAPLVDITAPVEETVVTAPIDVIGTATDANLLFYTLAVGPVSGGPFTEFARGTSAVVNGLLGKFDPSGLANDSYILRLTAQDANGSVATIDRAVSMAGGLKLGNFTLSFTDLSIPVSGVPITVARTYDTLTANRRDDLGFGWRLEFRNTQVRSSVAPTGFEELGIFNPFRDGTRVYVTLPGGQRQGFTFQPHINQLTKYLIGASLPQEDWEYDPDFVPDPGVTNKLTLTGATTMVRDGTTGEYFGLAGGRTAFNPANDVYYGTYILTTKDGLAYQIDAPTGKLRSVTDPNGNTLSFTDAGITSSTGLQVTFERDPQGHITSVIDPAGNRVLYQYDAQGDLVAVTDRAGNVTRFQYRTDRPHYLDKVIDPLGRTGVRTEYDDHGRLTKLIDAAGNPAELIYDPDHSLETVKDQLGNPTTYEYDTRGNIVTEINTLGGITSRTYDVNNNMLEETDPLGHTTAHTYDDKGNVLTQTDPLGNVTRFTYGTFTHVTKFTSAPVSQLLTTTDPLGNTTRNDYDAGGNLLSTTDAAGNATKYAYQDVLHAGNPTSITDPAGNPTHFEYNQFGQLSRQVDALGHETVFTHDANGNQLTQTSTLTTATGPRTLVTTNVYDAEGRIISVTDAEGNVTGTEYDKAGKRTATIDALGRRTEYRYDDRGQLVETIYPDSTPGDLSDNPRTRSEYNAAGKEMARIDEQGRRTEFRYDPLGRLIQTIYPDGTLSDPNDNPRTGTEYDAAGRVTAQIDERGNRTEFDYDVAGRQTVVRDALGHETVTSFDAAGHTVAQTDALSHTTHFVLDEAGRQVGTIYADRTSTAVTLDQQGRVSARTDQAGRTTRDEYDRLGRLTAVVDALGHTEYGYDEAGNLVSQKDANGHVTRYEYDGLGRRIATILPLGQRSSTIYDGVGNVLATVDFNGDTIHYEYDSRNRLVANRFPDGTSVEFTYTPTGQRATVTDARGLTQYNYDERDRLIARIDPDGQTIAYTYDAAGNRTRVITSAGTTSYTFDVLNRMDSVTDPSLGVSHYTYDAVSNLVRTELPNGTVETRQYDDLNHLLFLENTGPSGVISSYRYELSATGRRDGVVEHDGRRVQYDYDVLDRLTHEQIIDAVFGNRTIDYTYDAVGNRLSRNDSAEGLTDYTYDENDRLLTETLAGQVARYTYDKNGNTLSRVANATDQAIYCWDAANRLVEADLTGAGGTQHLLYQYDADGIRVGSKVDGEETRFLIDANRPLAQVVLEYRANGLIQVSYLYGLSLISQARGVGPFFYHPDGLGNTRALTDGAAVVTDRYAYDAFGRMLSRAGVTPNLYLFAGEQQDETLGLVYLRARYLQPMMGRFFGRDPVPGYLAQPLTQHLYLYAGANPVNFGDPSGRQYTLAELGAAVNITTILANIALPYFVFPALTIVVIRNVMGPGFEGRKLALDLITSTDNARVVDQAYNLYRRSNDLIALGAVVIDISQKTTAFAQAFVELGMAFQELVNSENIVVQIIGRLGSLGIRIHDVHSATESLRDAITPPGGGPPASPNALIDSIKSFGLLVLGILGRVEHVQVFPR